MNYINCFNKITFQSCFHPFYQVYTPKNIAEKGRKEGNLTDRNIEEYFTR